jgi:SUKH-3 immunity protein
MHRPRNWTPETEKLLRAAGSCPGRQVKAELPQWQAAVSSPGATSRLRPRPMSRTAEGALTEFGGLRALLREFLVLDHLRELGVEIEPPRAHSIPAHRPARPLVSGELFSIG